MLEIWGRATSSNVQALMWCVGELGSILSATMWDTFMAGRIRQSSLQ